MLVKSGLNENSLMLLEEEWIMQQTQSFFLHQQQQQKHSAGVILYNFFIPLPPFLPLWRARRMSITKRGRKWLSTWKKTKNKSRSWHCYKLNLWQGGTLETGISWRISSGHGLFWWSLPARSNPSAVLSLVCIWVSQTVLPHRKYDCLPQSLKKKTGLSPTVLRPYSLLPLFELK